VSDHSPIGAARVSWHELILVVAVAAAVIGYNPAFLRADPGPLSLSNVALAADGGDKISEIPEEIPSDHLAPAEITEADIESPEASEESKFPLSFGLSYYLYSDYIFRFVNFSEYPGEGREKPNHQMTTTVGLDLGPYGTLNFDTFFEWYAAQNNINGEGQNLQEVDYILGWTYPIEAIATELYLGVTWYAFPNDKSINTFEYNIGLSHNDAWMWKWLFPDNEDGVLNPSFSFNHDIDEIGGVWMEFAIEHPFEIIENLTITPGWKVAIDGCYWERHHMQFAGDQYSLVLEYDVGNLLKLPEWAGSVTVTGELYWTNPWGDLESNGIARDVLWGGMSVNWAWGG